MSDELLKAIDDLLSQAGLGLGDLDGGKVPSNFYREPCGLPAIIEELENREDEKGARHASPQS